MLSAENRIGFRSDPASRFAPMVMAPRVAPADGVAVSQRWMVVLGVRWLTERETAEFDGARWAGAGDGSGEASPVNCAARAAAVMVPGADERDGLADDDE